MAHFEKLYREPRHSKVAKMLKILSYFPRLAEDDDNRDFYKEISWEKLFATISCFKRDKSPDLDGLNVDFFKEFFEIISTYLLHVMEEIRRSGRCSRSINSTFLEMIPKVENLISFDDFRPIALCNRVYKIMAKIIVNIIKPFPSSKITQEQFGFV